MGFAESAGYEKKIETMKRIYISIITTASPIEIYKKLKTFLGGIHASSS